MVMSLSRGFAERERGGGGGDEVVSTVDLKG